MKRIIHYLFFILLLASVTQGCRHLRSQGGDFKWPAVSSDIDSLTITAEKQWMNSAPRDSIRHTIALIDSSASALDGEERRRGKVRALYWEGRYLKSIGEIEESGRCLKEALRLCDSVTDPYSYGRIMELRYLISNPFSEEFFKFLLNRYDYYREIGDLPQAANTAVHISNSLADPTDPGQSLRYLRYADSVFSVLNYEPYRLKLGINEASLLQESDNREEARIRLEELRRNPLIYSDSQALELVLRNHYAFFKDSASLFEAYSLVRPNTENSGVGNDTFPDGITHPRAFYEAFLGNHYLEQERIDSATRYMELSRLHLKELPDNRRKMNVYECNYRYYLHTGNSEKALDMLTRYLQLLQSIEESERPFRKQLMENVKTHREWEQNAAESYRKIKLRFYFILAALILLVGLLSAILIIRRQRQKMKAVKTQLELERGQRKLLALSISKEESNRILDYVKEEVGKLNKEGMLRSADISRIENNIRMHLAGKNEMDSFEKTFENVNPEFVKRLKERCPSLSENNIRLCSYILIGLSTRQIADLMNVRSASIKQSRWRLRSRLGLTTEESLEDFLRNISD
ncbi:hypothetical protein HDR69_05075 [bacterium]|nr:hypothetical protein [bacterium]